MAEPDPADRGQMWRDLKGLVRTAWDLDPRRLTVQVALLLFTGVVGGMSLLLLVPIVNSVADTTSTLQLPVLGEVTTGAVPLPVLLGAFVALTVVSALIVRTSAVNSSALRQVIIDRMRQDAFEAILAARWSFVLQHRRSDIIEIVTTGAARCGQAFQQLLSTAVTVVITFATAAVALWISPVVAAISIVGVAVLGLVLGTSLRPAHRMGRDFGLRNRKLQGVMLDSMDSLRLVRAHGADAVWAEQLGDAFANTREAQLANVRRASTVSALSSVGLAMSASLLVLISVWANVPATSIVVILVLVARLARGVQSLVGSAASLANSLPAVGDLLTLTRDAESEREVPTDAPAIDHGRPGCGTAPLVEFRSVAYTYPNSDNGLRAVDFTVPRGDITVLTGPSGAGKSTCADLALGMLAPDSGDVLIDGRPLVAADLPWWRTHVAYVPQETILVPGTLRENLAWSVPRDVSDDECFDALDRAAAAFARQLPDGLHTVLGDRGVRLSGGERQRVAIARALLRNPALLVLDEATSSLDDATEAEVIELVDSLAPDVTVLVIAHRQSTIASAHHRVRIEAGRTVADTLDLRADSVARVP